MKRLQDHSWYVERPFPWPYILVIVIILAAIVVGVLL